MIVLQTEVHPRSQIRKHSPEVPRKLAERQCLGYWRWLCWSAAGSFQTQTDLQPEAVWHQVQRHPGWPGGHPCHAGGQVQRHCCCRLVEDAAVLLCLAHRHLLGGQSQKVCPQSAETLQQPWQLEGIGPCRDCQSQKANHWEMLGARLEHLAACQMHHQRNCC